jgi:hypothetical protein
MGIVVDNNVVICNDVIALALIGYNGVDSLTTNDSLLLDTLNGTTKMTNLMVIKKRTINALISLDYIVILGRGLIVGSNDDRGGIVPSSLLLSTHGRQGTNRSSIGRLSRMDNLLPLDSLDSIDLTTKTTKL